MEISASFIWKVVLFFLNLNRKHTDMTTENQQNTVNPNSFYQKNEIKLDVFERRILLKLPKNERDIQFIRSMHFCKWDKIHFHWVIPNYPGNLERIQFYFGERINQCIEHFSEQTDFQNTSLNVSKNRDEVLLIQTPSKRIRIVFGFICSSCARLPTTWSASKPATN